MAQNQIILTVKSLLQEHFNIDPATIDLETHIDSLDLDSLDVLNLAAAFEKKFDVRISSEDLLEIRTIGEIVDRFDSRLLLANRVTKEAIDGLDTSGSR